MVGGGSGDESQTVVSDDEVEMVNGAGACSSRVDVDCRAGSYAVGSVDSFVDMGCVIKPTVSVETVVFN